MLQVTKQSHLFLTYCRWINNSLEIANLMHWTKLNIGPHPYVSKFFIFLFFSFIRLHIDKFFNFFSINKQKCFLKYLYLYIHYTKIRNIAKLCKLEIGRLSLWIYFKFPMLKIHFYHKKWYTQIYIGLAFDYFVIEVFTEMAKYKFTSKSK